MEWSIGGSTDLNWKKLATIVINDANYAGFGAEVEITDFSGNYGSSMAQYGDVYRGGLSIFHRAGTGIEPKQGIITINNDIAPYIRIYKIAGSGNSSYQIQVKSPGNYRQINVKLEEGIGNQVASITPHANDTNGSTSGGTAYTPDTYTNGNQFKTAFPTVTANRGNILYRLGVVNTAPSYPLDVTGTIRATGDVIAYSDIRVKENIKTIDNALDKVKALRGVEYNKIDNSEKSVGVIAQEIEEVIPEVVREDDQGMKSVAYGNITAVLIEAIKEQQKQIDELKKQLDAFTK
jgi:putative lipoic acid-binding regulatory protein